MTTTIQPTSNPAVHRVNGEPWFRVNRVMDFPQNPQLGAKFSVFILKRIIKSRKEQEPESVSDTICPPEVEDGMMPNVEIVEKLGCGRGMVTTLCSRGLIRGIKAPYKCSSNGRTYECWWAFPKDVEEWIKLPLGEKQRRGRLRAQGKSDLGPNRYEQDESGEWVQTYSTH